ncbi:MAG: hypothetical protein ACRDRP_01045 [Pseudonocardiaceae bacterium]
MTSLTLVTLVVISYGVLNAGGYGRALALGGATAAGAAVVIGSVAVPTFYAVALGTVVALGLQLLGHGRSPPPPRRRLPPGVSLLLLFLGWSAFVTVLAPILFDGTEVLTPAGARRLASGFLTSSNLAQVIYLVLGVCVVVFLARSAHGGPELIGLTAGATTLLSLWRYLNEGIGLPFPEGVFDNSPFLAYIETAAGGVERFRGILSEPAGLAASSLVTISYMLSRSLQVQGWRRAGALGVAGVAVFLGSISTSATFVVAGVVVALIAALAIALGFLLQRIAVSTLVSIMACALVIVALWVLPIIADFVEATVNEKVSSSSFTERSGANSASYDLFLDTFGIGVGLGANRASSFLAGLLSTTGLVGTLLFAAAVAGLIRRSAAVRECRPVVWALVTTLVLKTVAGPDLSDSSGILWMSLGLLSHAVLRLESRERAGPPVSEVGPAAPLAERLTPR